MNVYLVKNAEIGYLDGVLLDKQGLVRVLPAKLLRDIPPEHLQLWCLKRAVYTVPSVELIEWLLAKIGGRSAIEICAGNGAIGRSLSIPRTDSWMQTDPGMAAYYRLLGQEPITPPDDVARFEALQAVNHFRPQVVVASYSTQLAIDGDAQKGIGSSFWGVDEWNMLPKIETYIQIGNRKTHGDKRIRQLPHKVYKFDWLFTRSPEPNLNEIVVWGKNEDRATTDMG